MRWLAALVVLGLVCGCGSRGSRSAGFDIVFEASTPDIQSLNIKNIEKEIGNAFGSSVTVRSKDPRARNIELHVLLEFPDSMSAGSIADTLSRIDGVKSAKLRYSKFDSEPQKK